MAVEMKTCGLCLGTGKTGWIFRSTCVRCRGSGKERVSIHDIAAAKKDGSAKPGA